MWHTSCKPEIVTKPKNFNLTETLKLKLLQDQNVKSKELKLWGNSTNLVVTKKNCQKTQELKLWENSKTQIVTKLKNSKCDRTQKLKLQKLKNSSCYIFLNLN